MEVLFLLGVVVMANGQPTTTTAPAGEGCTIDPLLGKSLVSSLLLASGYSDKCVAAALDNCSSSSAQHLLSPLIQEAKELLQDVRDVVIQHDNRPRHCKDLLDNGDSGKGLRHVYPFRDQPHRRVAVYCDHTTDGGGWTVFQRRSNDTVRQDFYRTWAEYKLGFGQLEGEFWLGLDLLHELTSWALQELRIDLADYEGEQKFAKYGYFYIGSSETNYRLRVGRYSGDAGDSFAQQGSTHPGSSFSTYDADHDKHKDNCAARFRGAWWYGSCHWSNLNGFQYEGPHTSYADGISWRTWRGRNYSLRETAMMIRPAF